MFSIRDTTYQISCIEFQTSMNVPPTFHVKTVLAVPTQTAHTVATAQVDGQAQTVQLVKKHF
jgi:hypothetical protein